MKAQPSRPAKLTVACPVFNGESGLSNALSDISEQLRELPFETEIIIADNASSDSTQAICEEFQASESSGNVTYHRHADNIGLYPNYQFLLNQSKSEFIVFASHDDRIRGGYYLKAVQTLLADPSAVLAFPHLKVADPDTNAIIRYEVGLALGQGNTPRERFLNSLRCLETCGVHGVFRTESLKATSGFRNFVGADHILLNELSLSGRFVNLNEIFIDYSESMSKFSNMEHTLKVSGKNKAFKTVWIRENLRSIYLSKRLSFWEKWVTGYRTVWLQRDLLIGDFKTLLNWRYWSSTRSTA